MIRLQDGKPTNNGSSPSRSKRFFSFPKSLRVALILIAALYYSMGKWHSFLMTEQPGHEDHAHHDLMSRLKWVELHLHTPIRLACYSASLRTAITPPFNKVYHHHHHHHHHISVMELGHLLTRSGLT